MCSVRFEPLLFRYAHDARPRSPHAESRYSVSRISEANQSQPRNLEVNHPITDYLPDQNTVFLEVVVRTRLLKSGSARQRDNLPGPFSV
jgi:hypothetical protein